MAERPLSCPRQPSARAGRWFRRAGALAALLLSGLAAGHALGAAPEPMVFEGRIEPGARAEIAPGRDGKVAGILFRGGETVAKGDPLFRLDDAFQRLDLAEAEAALLSARAAARQAQAEAARIAELARRKAASQVAEDAARAAADMAAAALAKAGAERDAAQLRLDRSVLRAPMAGRIGPPLVALGAFVEAAAGPPMAEILSLDPVVVVYAVPWSERLAAMKAAGAADPAALFARLSLRIEAAGGALTAGPTRPDYAEAALDPATGAATLRARLANPGAALRPGMNVRVISTLMPEPIR